MTNSMLQVVLFPELFSKPTRAELFCFQANQLRILLTLSAYVLIQSIQEHSADEELQKAQMATLRDRLLLIGVHVRCSVRRVVLEFTRYHPWANAWLACARSLGCVPA